ncbi:hypothetical protein Daus18300_013329 [Diaporthe australafricana]|uniref:Major facilitator superfamily (MFS) profile domain-containing protein n=1 Tax=Diaporthe australafricana TaxID=127596 RepID=A0ABR3VZD6_9PEZI
MAATTEEKQIKNEALLQDQTNRLPKKQLLIVFTTMASAFLVAYADQNGIAVALPTMAEDLNAADTIAWAGTSSMIANTLFQVLYGRLSDIFGRKIIYLSAVALLAIGDILCATAVSAPMLYVARGLSGIAIGGVNSLTMMIVSDIVTLQERGRYQGILGSCIGLGNTIGPFLSAGFTQSSKTSWRGFFFLISPLMVCSGIASFFLLPSTPMQKGQGLQKAKLVDWWGLLTGTVAIVLLLIPVSGGGSYFAWDSPLVISMLSIAGVALVAFLLVEWKVSKLPMVPMRMFKTPAVAVILLQNFLFGYVYYSELYYLPIYFQNVRRVSPIVSAALLTPLVIAQMIFSVGSGFYISRFSRYGEVIWSGFTCWTLGSGLLCNLGQDTNLAVPIIAQIIIGVGVGNVFQPCLIALQAHSPKALRAVVISNRNFLRALGGAVGLACSSQLLQSSLRRALPAELRPLVVSSYKLPSIDSLSPTQASQVEAAYAQASHDVFISMVPIMGLCLVICVFIKDRGLSTKEEKPAAKDPGSDPARLEAPEQDSEKGASPSDTGSAGTDSESGGPTLVKSASRTG